MLCPRFLLLAAGLALLAAAPPARGQNTALTMLCDENFQHPPAGQYRVGDNASSHAELGPAGYTLRFTSPTATLVNQQLSPPGPALNVRGDFVLDAELRGQGTVGLYWNGRGSSTGNGFDVFQLDLAGAAGPGFSVWQLRQPQGWLKLTSGWLPGPAAAPDWHSLRVVRSGENLSYWLDGTRVWQQPWQPALGAGLGLTVQNAGSEVTLRQLRIQHQYQLKLAPDLPATLQREKLMVPGLNTEREENTPVVSADGRWLYFARVMGDVQAIDDPLAFNADCYAAERQPNGEWGPPRPLGRPVNNEASNYALHASPDGQSLLLANRYTPDGRPAGQGFSWTHRLADGRWSLPTALNTDNSQQPVFAARDGSGCLDASGTVIIHSGVLPGDLHNADLYVRRLQPDGRWSASVPLPAPVNTPDGQETTPFLAPDGRTLYFSSNGHPGYGGFDVFVSRRLDDSWLRWSEPLNLGPGINSAQGELYFNTTATGDYAYLASTEPGGSTDDIYRVRLPASLRPAATRLVRGRVLDARTRQLVPGAQVRYEQLPDGQQAGQVAAATGSFEIVLPAGRQYGFRAEAEGYVAASDNLDLRETSAKQPSGEQTSAEVSRDLYLVPVAGPPADAPRLVLHNVFFEQGRPVLLPASFPKLRRLAQLLAAHPTLRLRLEGHTDNQGPADKNQQLSEERVAAIKTYLVRQQVAPDRLETIGYGPALPIAPNDTEEHRRQNRRVEFVVLHP